MTMYTELLEAAMLVAELGEKTAPTERDRQEWKALNKVCRLEMYKTRGKIEELRKKKLDKDSSC